MLGQGGAGTLHVPAQYGVGERGRVLLSDDNGEHWRQAEIPVAVTLTAVRFASPTQGWIVGHGGVVLHTGDQGEILLGGLRGNAWRSEDGGEHFARVDVPISSFLVASLSLADGCRLVLSQSGEVLQDGGAAMRRLPSLHPWQAAFVLVGYALIALAAYGIGTWIPTVFIRGHGWNAARLRPSFFWPST